MSKGQQPIFGYPDFWQKVYDTYAKFFEVFPRACEALNSITTRVYENVEPSQKAILYLGMATCTSMMELTTLVGNGLGQGAMKIARTMLETAINAEYLRQFPGDSDCFLEWHLVEQHQLLNYMREHAPDQLSKLSNETIAETDKNFEGVRPKFEYNNASGKKRLRGSWCSLDLGSRAAKTDFQKEYLIVNRLGSRLIHGSIGGLTMSFDPEEEECMVAVPPSLNFCGLALHVGHVCLVRVVQTLAMTFTAETCHSVAQLTKDFQYAWHDAENLLYPDGLAAEPAKNGQKMI